MKQKSFIVFLLSVLIFSNLGVSNNSVSASTSSIGKNELSEETISLVDDFVSFEDNKFVIKDVRSVVSEIGGKEFAKVRQLINDRNKILRDMTAEELGNMYVVDNYVVFSEEDISDQPISLFSSRGKTTLEMPWWGFKLYLSDHVTNTVAQALAAGSGSSAMVAALSPILSAPTAVIKGLATATTIALGGSAAMFWRTNKGRGVYLRFTRMPFSPVVGVYTGMFAQ